MQMRPHARSGLGSSFGKGQEIGRSLVPSCSYLTPSKEFITKHNKLLLDAVALYQTTIEKKWSKAILENPDLSILPDLKRQIESSREIADAALRLLQTAVAEYRNHLGSLDKNSEPWVNMDKVRAQLHELGGQDFKENLPENQ